MRSRFVVDGPTYSRKKAAFKKLLKEHRLSWKGTMTAYVWSSSRDRVRADFERDVAKDVTLKATLTWEGKAKTPFLNALKTWVFSVGGRVEAVPKEAPSAAKARVEEELAFWDRVHKPDVEALRAAGRPEEWIEKDLREWKRAREQKRRSLADQ